MNEFVFYTGVAVGVIVSMLFTCFLMLIILFIIRHYDD